MNYLTEGDILNFGINKKDTSQGLFYIYLEKGSNLFGGFSNKLALDGRKYKTLFSINY